MVAFCQVSSTAGSKQADGRPGRGLVGGSLRRPWEPGFGAGGRAGQPDPTSGPTRRGAGRAKAQARRAELRSLRRPRNPAPRPAAAAAPADCGGAGGRAETWAQTPRRGGAGAGRRRRPGNSAHRTKGAGRRPAAGRGCSARWGLGSRRRRRRRLGPGRSPPPGRPPPSPPAAVGSLVGAEARGRGGGGRRRGGAGVERWAGLRLTAGLAAGPARPLCSSVCFPCALVKRGARHHHLQAPFPDSRRPAGAGAGAGPGRLTGAVAPSAAEPRAQGRR